MQKKIFSGFGRRDILSELKIIPYPAQKNCNVKFKNNLYNGFNNIIENDSGMPLWKRSFDITFSLFFLIIFSPLMLFTAALILIVSPGTVFFKQQRVGQYGKIFNLLKFRTMKTDNDDSVHREHIKRIINGESNGDLPMIKLSKDKRIISFGDILRNTCIDELPQFINVLKGEMSIVGPRPCIPYEAEEFQNWHKRPFQHSSGNYRTLAGKR